MNSANCPECSASITLASNTAEGAALACPECAAEHSLLSLDPLELVAAPEVVEDSGE